MRRTADRRAAPDRRARPIGGGAALALQRAARVHDLPALARRRREARLAKPSTTGGPRCSCGSRLRRRPPDRGGVAARRAHAACPLAGDVAHCRSLHCGRAPPPSRPARSRRDRPFAGRPPSVARGDALSPRRARARQRPGRAPRAAATAATAAAGGDAAAPSGLPAAVAAILRGSGLPAKSFAFDVRAVDGLDARPLLTYHADEPFLLASTTKVSPRSPRSTCSVPQHRWRTTAYATGPIVGGRLAGDLVIAGGQVGLTGNELRRWFAQMRDEGLRSIAGNIVLDDVALLHERDPKQTRTTAGGARAGHADRRAHVQPGQAARLGASRERRARRRDGDAAAGQRDGRQRRADGRRLRRVGALEDAGRGRLRAAAAALGARALAGRLPRRKHRLGRTAAGRASRARARHGAGAADRRAAHGRRPVGRGRRRPARPRRRARAPRRRDRPPGAGRASS